MTTLDPVTIKLMRESEELDRLMDEDDRYNSIGVCKFVDATTNIAYGALMGWLFTILVPIGMFIYLLAYHYFGWHIPDELASNIAGILFGGIILIVLSWFGLIGKILGWAFFILCVITFVPLIF